MKERIIVKILCLNPPFLKAFSREQRSPAVTKSGTIYYPMWLAYGAGSLIKAGHDVELVDGVARNWTHSDIEEYIRTRRPDLIVCATSTPSIASDISVATLAKGVDPGILTIFVGVHVSAEPVRSLEMCADADAVVIGEYDETLVEFAASASLPRQQWNGIRGLAWRDGPDIRINESRPYIDDLDSLPLVAETYHKFLNFKDYFYSIARWPEVTLITGRGCDHHCIYCVYPQNMTGHHVRYRSIDNVLDEWEFVEKNFQGVKELFIEDDAMTLDRERLRALMARKIERGIRIGFTANSRADVDYETLKWMKKGGCRLLCVGFESGNQGILDHMGKRLKLEQSHQFIRDAKKAGIMIHGCFLVGLPGETHETLEETLAFAKKLTPDTAQFFPLMVYPGTAAYKWAQKEGYLLTEDFSQWLTGDGMHNCVIEQPDLSNRELVEFCDRARREFYLRPRYMMFKLWQIMIHPEEATRTLKSMKKFWKYLIYGSFGKRLDR